MNITLIGYRGSGKSSVGRRLAEMLGMGFVDTDVLIVERAGCTIKEIFEREGEAGFREREAVAMREAASLANTVIAAGGGAVLRQENVAAMKGCGKVVWLQGDVQTLYRRIQGDGATSANRPNLTSTGGIEEVRLLLAKREPLYRAAADHVVDISKISVEQVADTLRRLLN
ncbi:MAG: shikimate kinase [Phycisphaerae bacterium]